MSNRNWVNKGNLYTYHAKPVLVDCSFIVDSTNGNGLGIRSLKSSGLIKNIFMHTSATPATGSPNPAAGTILVEFKDNYQRYLGGFAGFGSPVGSSITATTSNVSYVITSLGTATLAQWQAVGLPVGQTPAVGSAFVATASATIGGSATVAPNASTVSGCDHIEVLGDPNQTIAPSPQSPAGIGGQLLALTCLANAVATPANGTVIQMTFYFDDSSVLPGDGK